MVTVCINSFPLAKLKTAVSCISAQRKKILSFSIYSSSRCLHKKAWANFQLSMSFSLPVYLQTYLYEYKQGFELSSNKPLKIVVVSLLLTQILPGVAFYTPWKHQKTWRFSDIFRGYRKATPGCNGLMFSFIYFRLIFPFYTPWKHRFLMISGIKREHYPGMC